MKTYLYFFWSCLSISFLQAQDKQYPSTYNPYFAQAYQAYPTIPVGVLEAVAYTNTRMQHLTGDYEPSCIAMPASYTVMGLIKNGQGFFYNNLATVATKSSFSEAEILASPQKAILAYATAYQKLLTENPEVTSIEHQTAILKQLIEIPQNDKPGLKYATDSWLYSIYYLLNQKDFKLAYNIPDYEIDMAKIFGENNYQVLSSPQVTAYEDRVITAEGTAYDPAASGGVCANVSASFPYNVNSALAASDNYNGRGGTPITHITIHTMQGTYAGAIAWFQNSVSNVSAHYNIRSIDGQITQSVCEINRAWHVSNSNSYAIGIEHEGYVEDGAYWYSTAMYNVSATLTKDIATRRNINIKETYDKTNIANNTGLNPMSDACYAIKGHQHFPSQTHSDPGGYWDWERYYDLINGTSGSNPITTVTGNSGFFSDPGGTLAYGSNERKFYLIAPTSGGQVTLNFTLFNLEDNYDFLYVYDGDSERDSLIATLTGPDLPSSITTRSGKMFLEFRSDCSTEYAGWRAEWTVAAPPTCPIPTNINATRLSWTNVKLSWDAVPGATKYKAKIKRTLDAQWEYYDTYTNEIIISGLAIDALYQWSVQAQCSPTSWSPTNGTDYLNTLPISETDINSCSGRFRDTGGEIGEYRNSEDYVVRIAPGGATEVTMTFSSFSTELNYDKLYVYDGYYTPNGNNAILIGTYSGSIGPGTVVATSGVISLKFIADGSTVSTGWSASWSCTRSSTLPTTINNNTTQAGFIDCGINYHTFYDQGGATGGYTNSQDYIKTFCNSENNKSVKLNFRPLATTTQQINLKVGNKGNDYIYIYNGMDETAPLIGVYTGNAETAPQPGTFISSTGCITTRFVSNDTVTGDGWVARVSCADRPTVNETVIVGGIEGNKIFTDDGTNTANYSNNQSWSKTYCTSTTAPLSHGVWAIFNTEINVERNWDYLYVFDGNTTLSPLLGAFTGDANNSNKLGTIKTTQNNTSGCMTFQFFSDGGTNYAGWEANMTTGIKRAYSGTNDCSNATPIQQLNTVYAANNFTATGKPNNEDPALTISLATLPECSGGNNISRLENTIWYEFSIPNDTFCKLDSLNLKLNNVSCQNQLIGGAGLQVVIYETQNCAIGSQWGTPVYCADLLTNNSSKNIKPYLLANKNYYMLLDGFSAQHFNADIMLKGYYATTACSTASIATTAQNTYTVYPNPSNGTVNFDFQGAVRNATFLLYDITGKLLKSIEIKDANNFKLEKENLSNGLYMYDLLINKEHNIGKIIFTN